MKNMSESNILERIQHYFSNTSPNKSPNLLLGRGDDCAVLAIQDKNRNLLLTTDIFTENTHFRSSYFSPEAVAYKSMAVNISDVYAMGGRVESAQMALSLPSHIDMDYIDTFLCSLAHLTKEHGFSLSGGDLSKSEILSISITLIGSVDKDVKLYRNQASVHDVIFLVGDIGLSRLALNILEGQSKQDMHNYTSALKQHLFPQMYREASSQIANFAKKHKKENFSLMDVSDGLAQDLPRLIADYGYDLTMQEKDLHKEVRAFCKKEGYCERETLEFAIKGGEDYALLGTCPLSLWEEFLKACPCAKSIGKVIENKESLLNNKALSLHGFDHFNQESTQC